MRGQGDAPASPAAACVSGGWSRWLRGPCANAAAAALRALRGCVQRAAGAVAAASRRAAAACWSRAVAAAPAAARDQRPPRGARGAAGGVAARRGRRDGSVREAVLEGLDGAAAGRPCVSESDARLLGGVEAAASAARTRAHRHWRTDAAARRCARQAAAFLRLNDDLLGGEGDATGDAYDTLVEAWVVARCEPDTSVWETNAACGTGRDPRVAGRLRALLERLGYARDTAWPRSRAACASLGGTEADDAQHALPIFLWELVAGLQERPPQTVWDRCGVALLATTALAARRRGAATTLTVGQVARVRADCVRVSPRARPKTQRERVGQRPRRQGRPVLIQHWLVRTHVIPWVEWHQRRGTPASALLFPAITQERGHGANAAMAVRAGGQWVHPTRPWSDRQITAALQAFVLNRAGRTMQGLRAGNNIELRRYVTTEGGRSVSDVTRRTLHERSVRAIIGSENAYNEVFAEDLTDATAKLGTLRIVRDAEGLLTCVATNATAGEDPQQWVLASSPYRIAAGAAGGAAGAARGAAATSGAEEHSTTSSSTSAEEDEEEGGESDADVVGDGDRSTREVDCSICGAHMSARDYGYLCEREGCRSAVCTVCHPDSKKDWWCAAHAPRAPALLRG